MRSALILAAVLNGLAFTAQAQSTQKALSDLPNAVRDDIARVCLPVQYQQGAEAYRNCVTQEIGSRNSVSDVDVVLDSYTSLSFDDRYAIQQVCGGNNSESIDRNCMSKQIAELTALPVPNLNELSSDELYVMQQTCFKAQSTQGAAAYRQCQIDEISSVENIAKPNYKSLGPVERNALQLKCSATETQLSNYRGCLLNGTGGVIDDQTSSATQAIVASTEPALRPTRNISTPTPAANAVRITTTYVQQPDLSAALPAGSAQSVGNGNSEPATESEVLPEPINAIARTETIEPTIDTTQSSTIAADAPDAQSANEPSTEVESDTLGNTGTDNDSTAIETEAPSGNAAALEQLKDRFSNLTTSTTETLTNLSNQGKLLLAALLAMPIALWLLLAGRRRRDEDYEDERAFSREDLKRRVHAGPDNYELEEREAHQDPLSATWEAEADSLFDEQERQNTQRIEAVEPAHTRQSHENVADLALSDDEADDFNETQQQTTRVDERSRASGFAGWLHSQPQLTQQSLAIEFLIYWMAYGDERYDPSLKQRIFRKQDPTSHDLVKRWVLKEDIHAFADVVDWLQRHTTNIQKEQIVRLLMVLLINGDQPTPLQNTLLRFLSDVFYLNNPTLETLFEEEFGVSLPNMPRTDRMAWWERQAPGAVALWDLRTLNASDLITRHAAQLGVGGDARVEHVEHAYERALMRCRPENFDHLGEHEHQLIASLRTRLTQARDELLEALA